VLTLAAAARARLLVPRQVTGQRTGDGQELMPRRLDTPA
jgi:hypothetical protein